MKTMKNIAALVVGCLVAFSLLEVFFRIYNPFPFRVRGNTIELKTNQTEYRVNTQTPKLDSLIVHKKNGLGFRGSDLPEDFDSRLSIITVGGSTTECWYSSEGKDWPAHLAKNLEKSFRDTWVNNAGLDGHSTFGHQVLLNDYLVKLRPKIILFYAGINDMGTADFNSFDNAAIKGNQQGAMNFLTKQFEVVNIANNIARSLRAKKHQLSHNLEMDLAKEPRMDMTEAEITAFLEKYRPMASQFEERLLKLVDTCLAYGITPVFMTQPVLYGVGTDSLTGVDLETIKVWKEANGKAVWQLLELYNETTEKVAASRSCSVLDIAGKFPKNSRYFYDLMHYSNEGSELVGQQVWQELAPVLAAKFPNYQLN